MYVKLYALPFYNMVNSTALMEKKFIGNIDSQMFLQQCIYVPTDYSTLLDA